jgi:hypothetical protein
MQGKMMMMMTNHINNIIIILLIKLYNSRKVWITNIKITI